MIRAKMMCQAAAEDDFGNEQVTLYAVYDDGKANKSWSEATPAGNLDLTISNPAAKGKFEVGKEYYIDVTPA